jgi:hypothetical protein
MARAAAVDPALPAAANAEEIEAPEAQAAASAPRIADEPAAPSPLQSLPADKEIASPAVRRPRFRSQQESPQLDEPEVGDLAQGLEAGIERAPLLAEADDQAVAAIVQRNPQAPPPHPDDAPALDSMSSESRLKFLAAAPASGSGPSPSRGYAVIALEARGIVQLNSLAESGEWLLLTPAL